MLIATYSTDSTKVEMPAVLLLALAFGNMQTVPEPQLNPVDDVVPTRLTSKRVRIRHAAQRMRIDDLGKYAGTPATRRPCEPGTGLLPNEKPRLAKGVASHKGQLSWRWEELSPRYICNMSDVFFVHVGGNCGLNVGRCAIGGDPVWEYATQCQGWRGVVVEPSAGKFKMLKAFYRARVGRAVTPVRAAVSNYSGTASMPSGGSETSGLTEHQNRVRAAFCRSSR